MGRAELLGLDEGEVHDGARDELSDAGGQDKLGRVRIDLHERHHDLSAVGAIDDADAVRDHVAQLDDGAARDHVEVPALGRLEADARAVKDRRPKALHLVHDSQVVAGVGDATLAGHDGIRVDSLDVDPLGPLEGVREVLHLAAPGRVALQVLLASERKIARMVAIGCLRREPVVEEPEHVESGGSEPSEGSGVHFGGRRPEPLENAFFKRFRLALQAHRELDCVRVTNRPRHVENAAAERERQLAIESRERSRDPRSLPFSEGSTEKRRERQADPRRAPFAAHPSLGLSAPGLPEQPHESSAPAWQANF